jgi:hypothetical protein
MDKPSGNAQSQTCSAHFTVVSSVASDKVIENEALQIVGNAGTGVLNLEHHLVPAPVKCRFLGGGLAGILSCDVEHIRDMAEQQTRRRFDVAHVGVLLAIQLGVAQQAEVGA